MTAGDRSENLQILSPLDGSVQSAALRLPHTESGRAAPLVYAPHPFGWTVEEDYHGGCADLRATHHDGWQGVASDLGVAVIQPAGHHRRVPNCSLGYEGVVRDIPEWIAAVGERVRIDPDRVYACGLSMGGLESLLAVGSHPLVFAAAFVFNPVVDVAAWQEDLARTPIPDLRAEKGDRLIIREVGGTPETVPELYRTRSPIDVLGGLRRVPLTIWWSADDAIVPRQIERHGKWLYDALKRADAAAAVTEYEHSSRYGFGPEPTDDQGWAIHETAEYAFAVRWLLLHHRMNERPVLRRDSSD